MPMETEGIDMFVLCMILRLFRNHLPPSFEHATQNAKQSEEGNWEKYIYI